jgi:regulatory protein
MRDDGRAGHGEPGLASTRDAAYAKALDLLALRPHFALELSAKLNRRGFDEETIRSTVARLVDRGYLDDLEAGRSFVAERAVRSGWGPRRLRAELARRGVEEEAVERLVRDAFPEGETAAVRQAALRWVDRGGRGRDRLARFLDRRGFSKGAIIEILNELASGLDENEEF